MIHIFFSTSAAGTFRQLLESRGIDEEVADITDELDMGPISHGELANREPWLNRHTPLDFGDRDWLAATEQRFRRQVTNDLDRLIWIAPASATEQAGLYWYLSHFGGDKTLLAIADYPFGATWNGNAPLSLGELALEPMQQLYETCPRVQWQPSLFDDKRWNTLVAENALLRVVDDGVLRSAPVDYFDNLLLARCPAGWEKWHRVIGDTMGDIWDTGQTAGSDLLLWRLRALIESGQVACNGESPLFGASVSDAVKIRRVE